jgi:hypothetical protein
LLGSSPRLRASSFRSSISHFSSSSAATSRNVNIKQEHVFKSDFMMRCSESARIGKSATSVAGDRFGRSCDKGVGAAAATLRHTVKLAGPLHVVNLRVLPLDRCGAGIGVG